MTRNKPRLYVVCFFRTPQQGGNPDPYHWGLASGPKGGGMDGMLLYHVRNIPTAQGVQWQFEDPPRNLSSGPTPAMLTFTAVAKIEDLERLEQVLRDVPINTAAAWDVFNCQIWVEQALAAVMGDGRCVGTNAIPADWTVLHQQCTSFSDPIRQMRVQGETLPSPRPMQNLLPS
ncbi:uncharacterized protein E0L32_002489 [Thyridium curvatum]|uniref:Uncharacterized protein n=1 Tax=Thyridium curvatum TaxID=1093900 RepID=A0A507B8J1_9PEZI|nr:uncharacterized protein E0L32_002489 [Thyridium curvatum]TPX18632.1 hypothetical protein E0L32_002489 [Thyridium curvatum]